MAYRKSDSYFVNPYHFVPLGTECTRSDIAETRDRPDLMTGWIECTLTAQSPLFVPNSSNDDLCRIRDDAETVKSYDFASYEDLSGQKRKKEDWGAPPAHPIIPGSELRGVIRSAFEAVTNSCMSIIDDAVLYKRSTTPGKPVVFTTNNRGYTCFDCERIGVATWKKYGKTPNEQDPNDFTEELDDFTEELDKNYRVEGQTVHYLPSEQKYKNHLGYPCFTFAEGLYFGKKDIPAGMKKGYVHMGENFMNKHHESLFTNPRQVPFDETGQKNFCKAVKNFYANMDLYADKTVNQAYKSGKHRGYKRTNIQKEGIIPVYCKKIGERFYLSPAAIGREVFYNRVYNLIRSYTPCADSQHVCPACALFGFVAEAREQRGDDAASAPDALSGRVRFSDASLVSPPEGKTLFLAPRPLPELASPKPSATEFYLEKPSQPADMWNYDYALNWTGSNRYETVTGYKPQIRGRKFYWHSDPGEEGPQLGKGERYTQRHVFVRPLRKGAVFGFKVYFDRVTPEELKKLLWVLTIGGKSDHGHKLGMGKPIGLGSVSIAVKDVKQRRIGPDAEYALVSRLDLMEDVAGAIEETGTIKAFLRLTELRPAFKYHATVEYPHLEGETDKIYRWFVGNKSCDERDSVNGLKATGTRPVIDQCLPDINKPELQKLTNSNQSYSRGGSRFTDRRDNARRR